MLFSSHSENAARHADLSHLPLAATIAAHSACSFSKAAEASAWASVIASDSVFMGATLSRGGVGPGVKRVKESSPDTERGGCTQRRPRHGFRWPGG